MNFKTFGIIMLWTTLAVFIAAAILSWYFLPTANTLLPVMTPVSYETLSRSPLFERAIIPAGFAASWWMVVVGGAGLMFGIVANLYKDLFAR